MRSLRGTARGALLLGCAFTGCTSSADGAAAGGRGPAGDPPNDAPAAVRADTLPRVAWDRVDRGTGILYFADPSSWDPDASAGRAPDTIALVSRPAAGTRVATFVCARDWSVALVQEEGEATSANLLEYAYEEVGLPTDSLVAGAGRDATWVRVLYGQDANGAAVRAWALVDERLVHRTWREHLPEQALTMPGDLELFEAPGGRAVLFRPVREGDYVIEPDSVAGDWLRARVSSPHPCSGEPAARETVAWLRFLDGETGRPRVWYFTRGC